jgi:hypothetical protein
MCRNIKSLYNFDPPATDEEIRAAAVQFVRKVSGFHEPSKQNEAAFNRGVKDVARATQQLLESLETQAHPHNREVEAAKARARAVQRFGGNKVNSST